MKRTRAALPELTRLYLRACEILKIFDIEDRSRSKEQKGSTRSSDNQADSVSQAQPAISADTGERPGQSQDAL